MSVYRLFGNELSPYSVKVRSYLRFKGLAHEWIVRNAATEEEFSRHARLPLIPLLLTPAGEALQDSTPILETLEERFPEPSIIPHDPLLAFLSALLEEYADEWLNKPMFHYRWYYDEDAASAAARLAASLMPEADAAVAAAMIRRRMVDRLRFVGSSAETKDVIEDSLVRLLQFLERHLETRSYVFGERPALADFGLFGQLFQCLSDPTPGRLLREQAPHVVRWVERMEHPTVNGPFEPWASLAPSLEPILREEVGAVFVPWTLANEDALQAGKDQLEVQIRGKTFRQTPQKYHAKSLAMLRQKFRQQSSQQPALTKVLASTGCAVAFPV
ncbi:MAG: glutathione S-transferase family protein [Candidatus Binatia bacterium]|nr:glutathione S-transferase family protein [Candidatus Binatia bacterium]